MRDFLLSSYFDNWQVVSVVMKSPFHRYLQVMRLLVPPPTAVGEQHCFWTWADMTYNVFSGTLNLTQSILGLPCVVRPFVSYTMSLYCTYGVISMKLATNICLMSGNSWKGFQGQERSRSQRGEMLFSSRGIANMQPAVCSASGGGRPVATCSLSCFNACSCRASVTDGFRIGSIFCIQRWLNGTWYLGNCKDCFSANLARIVMCSL